MESDQCILCAHYQMLKECDAFPDGIPDEIFDGTFDHREPYDGDHGIRFIPIKTNQS